MNARKVLDRVRSVCELMGGHRVNAVYNVYGNTYTCVIYCEKYNRTRN